MFDSLQLLDHLSIGITVLDTSMGIVFWNRWMEEHSLLSREDAVGKPIYHLFPSLAQKGFTDKVRYVFQHGRPAFFNRRMQQSMFPFPSARTHLKSRLDTMQQTVILSPLKDADGVTVQVLVSVFDITDWIAHQRQLRQSKKELERLSQLDDLTQIANRRAIMEKLRQELSLHDRKKRPLALAMLDIDLFKKINDNYGHQCGDHVLAELAAILSEGLRGYDVVGRYGGEEFVLILPETDREQALLITDRLRARVEKASFRFDGHDFRLTVSIGVALKDAMEIVGIDQLFRVADDCLYKAKKAGRNTVVAQD